MLGAEENMLEFTKGECFPTVPCVCVCVHLLKDKSVSSFYDTFCLKLPVPGQGLEV